MTSLIQSIKKMFSEKEPLPSGMFSYQTPADEKEQYRLHLRIEKDGTGILIINASTVLHLNQTAAEFAYHFIKKHDLDKAVSEIARRYQVDKEQARLDFGKFLNQIQTIIHTPDLDPVTYFDIERQEPYSGEIAAPYRLDCALTYRVGEGSHSEHAPLDRVDRELTIDEWVTILQKAFEIGIPHVLFTGGEPTLRDDLPELLLKAEELGLVTGVLTDGLRLKDDEFRQQLLLNGLDHLMVVLDPNNPNVWESLAKVLPEDIHTTVHITLEKGHNLRPHITRLAEMGVNALSLSASDAALSEELQNLRDFAAVQQLELIWDLPVPYSRNNPVSLELENAETQETPEGAGKAWLYVEPDGDVLPAQGMYDRVLGNLLTDPWEAIWD